MYCFHGDFQLGKLVAKLQNTGLKPSTKRKLVIFCNGVYKTDLFTVLIFVNIEVKLACRIRLNKLKRTQYRESKFLTTCEYVR